MYLSMGGTSHTSKQTTYGAPFAPRHRPGTHSLGAVDSRKPVGGVSVKGGHDNGPVAAPSKLEKKKSGLGEKWLGWVGFLGFSLTATPKAAVSCVGGPEQPRLAGWLAGCLRHSENYSS